MLSISATSLNLVWPTIESIEGEATHEPAFGLPAVWIKPSQRDAAEAAAEPAHTAGKYSPAVSQLVEDFGVPKKPEPIKIQCELMFGILTSANQSLFIKYWENEKKLKNEKVLFFVLRQVNNFVR